MRTFLHRACALSILLISASTFAASVPEEGDVKETLNSAGRPVLTDTQLNNDYKAHKFNLYPKGSVEGVLKLINGEEHDFGTLDGEVMPAFWGKGELPEGTELGDYSPVCFDEETLKTQGSKFGLLHPTTPEEFKKALAEDKPLLLPNSPAPGE